MLRWVGAWSRLWRSPVLSVRQGYVRAATLLWIGTCRCKASTVLSAASQVKKLLRGALWATGVWAWHEAPGFSWGDARGADERA